MGKKEKEQILEIKHVLDFNYKITGDKLWQIAT